LSFYKFNFDNPTKIGDFGTLAETLRETSAMLIRIARLFLVTMALALCLSCSRLNLAVDRLRYECQLPHDDSSLFLKISNDDELSNIRSYAVKADGTTHDVSLSQGNCIDLDDLDQESVIIVRADSPRGVMGTVLQISDVSRRENPSLIMLKPYSLDERFSFCSSERPNFTNSSRIELFRLKGDPFFLRTELSVDGTELSKAFQLLHGDSPAFELQNLAEGRHSVDVSLFDPFALERGKPFRRFTCLWIVDQKAPNIEIHDAQGGLLSDTLSVLAPGTRLNLNANEDVTIQYCLHNRDRQDDSICGVSKNEGYISVPAKGRWRLDAQVTDQAGNRKNLERDFNIYDKASVGLIQELSRNAQDSWRQGDALGAIQAESMRKALGTPDEAEPLLMSTKAALLTAALRTQEVKQIPIDKMFWNAKKNATTGKLIMWPRIRRELSSDGPALLMLRQETGEANMIGSTNKKIFRLYWGENDALAVMLSEDGWVWSVDLQTEAVKVWDVFKEAGISPLLLQDAYYSAQSHRIYLLAGLNEQSLISLDVSTGIVSRHSLPVADTIHSYLTVSNTENVDRIYLGGKKKSLLTCTSDIEHCQPLEAPCPADTSITSLDASLDGSLVFLTCDLRLATLVWDARDLTTPPVTAKGGFSLDTKDDYFVTVSSATAWIYSKSLKASILERNVGSDVIRSVNYSRKSKEFFIVSDYGFDRVGTMGQNESLRSENLALKSAFVDDNKDEIYLINEGFISIVSLSQTVSTKAPFVRFAQKPAALLYLQNQNRLAFQSYGKPEIIFDTSRTFVKTMELSPQGRFALVELGNRLDVISDEGVVVLSLAAKPKAIVWNEAESSFGYVSAEGVLALATPTGNCAFQPMQMKINDRLLGLHPTEATVLIQKNGHISIMDCTQNEKVIAQGELYTNTLVFADMIAFADQNILHVLDWNAQVLRKIPIEIPMLKKIVGCPIAMAGKSLVNVETGLQKDTGDFTSKVYCSNAKGYLAVFNKNGVSILDSSMNEQRKLSLDSFGSAAFGYYGYNKSKGILQTFDMEFKELASSEAADINLVASSSTQYFQVVEKSAFALNRRLYNKYLDSMFISVPNDQRLFRVENGIIWSNEFTTAWDVKSNGQNAAHGDLNSLWILPGRNGILFISMSNESLVDYVSRRLNR
jgi:hypothetical protein